MTQSMCSFWLATAMPCNNFVCYTGCQGFNQSIGQQQVAAGNRPSYCQCRSQPLVNVMLVWILVRVVLSSICRQLVDTGVLLRQRGAGGSRQVSTRPYERTMVVQPHRSHQHHSRANALPHNPQLPSATAITCRPPSLTTSAPLCSVNRLQAQRPAKLVPTTQPLIPTLTAVTCKPPVPSSGVHPPGGASGAKPGWPHSAGR